MKKNKFCAVILGSGSGSRMKSSIKKQFLTLENGIDILSFTINQFCKSQIFDEIIIVLPENDEKKMRTLHPNWHITIGGKRRQDSVRNGLLAIKNCNFVFIHDGVRPFITTKFLLQMQNLVLKKRNIVSAIPVKNTIKMVTNGMIEKTLNRKKLWQIQTPQVFPFDEILKAHLYWQQHSPEKLFTDDATMMEELGHDIYIIEGADYNIKITTPYDYKLAKFIYAQFNNWD